MPLPLIIGAIAGGLGSYFSGKEKQSAAEEANAANNAAVQERFDLAQKTSQDALDQSRSLAAGGKKRTEIATQQMRDLAKQGFADQRTALQGQLTDERGQIQSLFGDIRDEARTATGRLGTIGGSPEQSLVSPQIDKLSQGFGNRVFDLTQGINQNALSTDLGLLGGMNDTLNQFDQSVMGQFGNRSQTALSGALNTPTQNTIPGGSPFGDLLSGALGGAGLGIDAAKYLQGGKT